MATPKHLPFLVIIVLINFTTGDISDNRIDDFDPVKAITNEIMKDKNMKNLGSFMQNIMQSTEAAKDLGLMDLMDNKQLSGILQGLKSMVGANTDKANLMASVVSVLGNQKTNSKGETEPLNIGSLFSMGIDFVRKVGGEKSLLETLPMIAQTFSDFVGSDAKRIREGHKDHEWMLPPFLEKIHVLLDLFFHSEMGRSLLTIINQQKFVKVFLDETGRFSYDKFVQMFENHSFRKYWIKLLTDRIAYIITYLVDPQIHSMALSAGQEVINSYLQSFGFPKKTLIDPNRLSESVTALVNYISKNYLGYKLDSKPYVKPAVDYAMELFQMAQRATSTIHGVNYEELSHRMADTINLEIIEPITRVNRAYKFARKIPKCDKYVICLINQRDQNSVEALPELKSLLYKASSVVASWYLSNYTSTSFWVYFSIITTDDDCKSRYREECHDFHMDEIRVTTEFFHSEL